MLLCFCTLVHMLYICAHLFLCVARAMTCLWGFSTHALVQFCAHALVQGHDAHAVAHEAQRASASSGAGYDVCGYACVRIRQFCTHALGQGHDSLLGVLCISVTLSVCPPSPFDKNSSASVKVPHHTSPYLTIRQHTSAYVSIRL